MKNLTMRLFHIFGIALLAMAMVFFFAACQQEPDNNDNNNSGPQIPSALQNTEWSNSAGEKISFDKDSVTVTPKNGSPQKFSLKDTLSLNQGGIDQTTLYFKDNQSPDDTITYRNGVITFVNFSIIQSKSNTPPATSWIKGSGGDGGNDPNTSPLEDFEIPIDSYNGKLYIYKYLGNGGNIVIPSIYNNLPIEYIEGNAFNSKNITSVVIPDSITYIGSSAFASNPNLTSITIGYNVELGNNSSIDPKYSSFGNNFVTAYKDQYNKAKGTYTRTIGSDVWTKVN